MRTDGSYSAVCSNSSPKPPSPPPHHRPTVGWMSDLNSATDAQKFFDKYYVPSNMVVASPGM
jgi:hypothetical protein